MGRKGRDKAATSLKRTSLKATFAGLAPGESVIDSLKPEEQEEHVRTQIRKMNNEEDGAVRRRAAEALADYVRTGEHLPEDMDPHPAEILSELVLGPRKPSLLVPALEQIKIRRERLEKLPAVTVRIAFTMSGGDPWTPRLSRELLEAFCTVIGHDCEHEHVDINNHDMKLLEINVTIGGHQTANAVLDAVGRAIRDESDPARLKRLIINAGVIRSKVLPENAQVVVPLERIQAEIELQTSQTVPLEALEKIPPVMAKSYQLYMDNWLQTLQEKKPPKDTGHPDLREIESQYRFKGELMPISEGRRHNWIEDIITHGRNDAEGILADAARAQITLKRWLCQDPQNAWAQEVFDCDATGGAPDRFWRSPDPDPPPPPIETDDDGNIIEKKKEPAADEPEEEPIDYICKDAEHYDPGLEDVALIMERARALQSPWEKEPAMFKVVGISRLVVLFDAPKYLQVALQGLLDLPSHTMGTRGPEVVWILNGFRDPPCDGYRTVRVGIKQRIPADDTYTADLHDHISELQLTLRDQWDLWRCFQMREMRKKVRDIFSNSGIPEEGVERVNSVALRGCEATPAQLGQEAAVFLRHITDSFIQRRLQDMPKSEAVLAKECLTEQIQHCTAYGVPWPRIEEYHKLMGSSEFMAALGRKTVPQKNQLVSMCRSLAIMGENAAKHAGLALAKLLQHSDEDVRGEAARTLGEMGAAAAPYAAEELGAFFPNYEPRLLSRYQAALTLKCFGPAGVAGAYGLAVGLEDEDVDVRNNCCKALSVMGSAAVPAAATAVVKALNTQEMELRRLAAETLANMGEGAADAAMPTLISILRPVKSGILCFDGEDVKLRRLVAVAISRMGHEAVRKEVRQISRALGDRDPEVRETCRAALEAAGCERALHGSMALFEPLPGDEPWPPPAPEPAAEGEAPGEAEDEAPEEPLEDGAEQAQEDEEEEQEDEKESSQGPLEDTGEIQKEVFAEEDEEEEEEEEARKQARAPNPLAGTVYDTG